MTGSIDTTTPAGLEEDSYVERQIEELAYTWINRILALAIGMWTLFAIPDYLFSYDLMIKILPIRLVIVAGLVVVMIMNRTMKRTSRNQFIYSVLAMGGSALATAFICVSYEEHENIHYLAMLLIVCAGMGFVPMDFLKSLFLVCLVYVTYLASVLLFGVINEPKSFLLINTYLVSATAMLLMMRYIHQSNLSRTFRLQHRLEHTVSTQKNSLNVSTALLQTLVQGAADGIVITDRQGVILEANRKFCEMLDVCDSARVMGNRITDLPCGEHWSELLSEGSVLFQRRTPLIFEMSPRNAQGEKRDIEVSVISINVDGNVFVQSNYRDITERKKVYSHLSQAQRMESLAKLACGMAHDFRNVLATMATFADFLKAIGEKEAAEFKSTVLGNVEVMEREVTNANRILSDLLCVGARSRQEFDFFSLERVIEVRAAMYSAMHPNITVNFSVSDDVPQVYGSEGQIDQVLVNLFMNSRDAMGESGRIDIALEVANDVPGYVLGNTEGTAEQYIRVRFTDTGSGIPEDHILHIFEPFYTTKNNGKQGAGLGLSTVYNIIMEHNGSVSVSSTVGVGTTFDLYLPVVSRNDRVLSRSWPAMDVKSDT